MMKPGMLLSLLALSLAACDPEATAPPSPCEARALAVCSYYQECYPDQAGEFEACVHGNVVFCEAAGEGQPDEALAERCVSEIDAATSTCEAQPGACSLRVEEQP